MHFWHTQQTAANLRATRKATYRPWLEMLEPRLTMTAPIEGWHLVFQDEFNGTALNRDTWHVIEDYRRDHFTTPEAATVADGQLTITTYTENKQHFSAILNTSKSFLSTYGYYEARINFNQSPGEWSGFWLLAPDFNSVVGDPGRGGAEVDIVETRASGPNGEDVRNLRNYGVHWDGNLAPHHKLTWNKHVSEGLQGKFHTYGVLWTPEGYDFYYDGQHTGTITDGVTHRSLYLNISSHVEDGEWAGNIPEGGFGDRHESTTQVIADYIRVWQSPDRIRLDQMPILEPVAPPSLVIPEEIVVAPAEPAPAEPAPVEPAPVAPVPVAPVPVAPVPVAPVPTEPIPEKVVAEVINAVVPPVSTEIVPALLIDTLLPLGPVRLNVPTPSHGEVVVAIEEAVDAQEVVPQNEILVAPPPEKPIERDVPIVCEPAVLRPRRLQNFVTEPPEPIDLIVQDRLPVEAEFLGMPASLESTSVSPELLMLLPEILDASADQVAPISSLEIPLPETSATLEVTVGIVAGIRTEYPLSDDVAPDIAWHFADMPEPAEMLDEEAWLALLADPCIVETHGEIDECESEDDVFEFAADQATSRRPRRLW